MLIFTLVCELLGVAILLITIYFLGRPIVHGAIYFPTSARSVDIMMRLAKITPGEKVIDLGSGDGRILIAASRAGAEVVGYEINPVLVRKSRHAIEAAGVRAVVHWESFWSADLSQFDVIIVYGIPYIMKDLMKKFERELRPDTKIISNAFALPGLQVVAQERKIMMYVWQGTRS